MIFFDLDGTLIDSNGVWREVDHAFMAKRGLELTEEYIQTVTHSIFPVAARFTKEHYHLPDSTEDIMAEWQSLAYDAYTRTIPLKEGARELLEMLPGRESESPFSLQLCRSWAQLFWSVTACCAILKDSFSPRIQVWKKRTRKSIFWLPNNFMWTLPTVFWWKMPLTTAPPPDRSVIRWWASMTLFTTGTGQLCRRTAIGRSKA